MKRVRRLSEPQLREVCLGQQMLSDVGRVSAFKDGLVVVTDTVEVLNRVADLLESVEAAEAVTWVVQMHVVQPHGPGYPDLGLDTVRRWRSRGPGRCLLRQAALRRNRPDGEPQKCSAGSRTRREASGIVAEPLFLLVDGEEGI